MRIEFLDPLLAEFGWDVSNSAGVAAPLREVISEDSIEIEGSQKAPDYGFRIGQKRVLFLEAKSPSAGIEEAASALQVRRYGWSAQLPISILTDFKSFAIYDCRVRPSGSDDHNKALVKRFDLFSMSENDWASLKRFLHRSCVSKGSLEEFTETDVSARGAVPVDQAFLGDLEEWRARLATHLYRKDNTLSKIDLSSLVQKNIDRLLFLRIAEDRGAEPHGKLLKIAQEKDPFSALMNAFQQAEARYNSSLFHFAQEDDGSDGDHLTERLKVSPRLLRLMIKRMYRPQSPYEFGVFSVELLGQIYEQFLGSEIEFSNSAAKIEQKPEVKKAGGVYYTPSDISALICAEALKDFDPAKSQNFPTKQTKASTFRILDPACGSGSFLIAAYQQLLDRYLIFYSEASELYLRGKTPRLIKDEKGGIRLSIDEKKRILLSHIYGADIDHQAVEVSKLSLLLKMLEGENQDTLAAQMDLFESRVLPNLSNNIVAGNSLVGTDFFDDLYSEGMASEELDRQNPFDWENAFPFLGEENAGFEAIVGNPPYIDSEWMVKHWPAERTYCSENYDFIGGNWDIYCAFVGRSVELLKSGGFLGFIVPNKLMSADYAATTRSHMGQFGRLERVFDYSSVPVFPVSVYPVVFTFRKDKSWGATEVVKATKRSRFQTDFAASENRRFANDGTPWFSEDRTFPLEHFEPLKIAASLCDSATVGEAYDLQKVIADTSDHMESDLRVLNSGTIDPGISLWGIRPMRYLGRSIKHPVLRSKDFATLPSRRIRHGQAPKILCANMTKKLEAFYDSEGEYIGAKSTVTLLARRNPWTIACILNSDFMAELYINRFSGRKLAGGYIQVAPRSLETVPIPKSIPAKVEQECEKLLTKFPDLVRLIRVSSGPSRQVAKRKFSKVQSDIEKLVVELYTKVS